MVNSYDLRANMRVLVIGSGGREHALCWRLRQSRSLTELFCAPGNPGIGSVAKLVPLRGDDIPGLVEFARNNSIDLTIVGPELPLSLGVTDAFRNHGMRIFGPSHAAAKLENSKAFAKEILLAANVPTAGAELFHDAQSACLALTKVRYPIVIKADGLAAGKGVYVCEDRAAASDAIDAVFTECKSSAVLLEEFLDGVEASLIIATDGSRIIPLPLSHDYKRIFDGDRGPNTGGMGSVSPSNRVPESQVPALINRIIVPVLAEMRKRRIPFCGFLYAGLMISRDGTPMVLEFNTRLGDPETQSIMRRIDGDLVTVLNDLAQPDHLAKITQDHSALALSSDVAVCAVLASAGYPEKPRYGDAIEGIEFANSLPETLVFHAGTSMNSAGQLVTAGGRVLSVTTIAETLNEARSRLYRSVDMIQFAGVQVRRDLALEEN